MVVSENVERDFQGVPLNEDQRTAEMFLKEFLYRVTDPKTEEINVNLAINTLLKMREVNSFEFFGKRNVRLV